MALTTRLDTGALPVELNFRTVEERTLNLDKIETLQYQPSSVQSELNQSLYESIKQVGLQSPLVVAHVPNEKHYVPIAGGILGFKYCLVFTEKRAMNPLRSFNVLYLIGLDLARARLAHVITNQVRIRYSFASRALAIVHIVDSERTSNQSRSMSQRDAVQFLTSNGYPISQSILSYMEYLVYRLQPRVSLELLNAASLNDVRELREIENTANENYRDQIELSLDFNEFFASRLKEAASESTDIDDLIERVRYKVSFLGEGSGLESHHRLDETFSSEEKNPIGSTDPMNQSLRPVIVEQLTKSSQAEISQTASSDESSQPDCNTTLPSNDALSKEWKVTAQRTIGELRESAWTAASHLCSSFDMNKCIINVSKQFGYEIVAKPNCDSSTIQYRLWNYLDVFAGSDYRPLDVNVWTELNDEDWRALIELWDAVRLIRRNRRTDGSEPLSSHAAAG